MTCCGATWSWPLDEASKVPVRGKYAFGVERKHDVHPGVDLLAPAGESLFAVSIGTVVAIVDFTGPLVGSPWYLPTQAVIVEQFDGRCVLYGEIHVAESVRVGNGVRRGSYLGRVAHVRRPNWLTWLGLRPSSMLHLELWQARENVLWHYLGERAKEPNDWPLGAAKPTGLLDPTPFLMKAELPE